MKRIFTFLLLFISTTVLHGQETKLDYDNDSRWFWGLNIGGTWSSADVKYETDLGWGLVLGKSFNYGLGKPFSFDIRGRFLMGDWIGQDVSRESGIDSTNLVYQPYYSLGQNPVLNHQTRATELGLELVLHFNNLRARTGWDPYVFGGIGYTWFQSKTNLYNDQALYNYDSLATLSLNQTGFIDAQDGSYETDASTTTGNWMPSVGVGLGYQFGPRFSMGVEHKTTFTRLDDFDGFKSNTGTYPNDWFHYTSAYMRFQIRDHSPIREDNNTNNNSLGNVNNYNGNTNFPPVVDFTAPSISGTTVSVPTYSIRANIQHVTSQTNVVFRHNGNYISNFIFNPSTQSFECLVNLVPGQNVFELTGSNTLGSDHETTVINYVREQNNPPVITYTNPASSPATVQNAAFNLTANVTNIQLANQMSMTVNGQPVQFTYNSATTGASANLVLQVGTNIVTTIATNSFGTDQESITIIYQPVQTVQLPIVYFVDPNSNPYTTSRPNFIINADVLNVAGSQNITFKQNGAMNQNFTYNAQTDDFQSSVVLNPGQNVFEIIATNAAGSAQASTIIIYNRVAPKPPIVTITNPASTPYNTNSSMFNLAATVLNVTQASQITVNLNNQNIAFSYNNVNNNVTANLNLVVGTNVVVVTGTNADGTDSKQVTIIYRQAQQLQPPVVNFTNPNVNPYTSQLETMTLTSSVLNVASIQGVNVNVNGTNVTNFTFANSTVTLPLTLLEGANVITVTGTNAAGTDSKSQTIIYRKPAVIQPPVVTFIDPAISPITVYNNTYNVRARVRFVQGASNITLKINGQTTNNFTYSASSEIMDFTTALVVGANVVEITATNTAGQDQKSTTIIYRVNNPAVPPVVTITNPASNPSTVNENTAPIQATVLNVDGPQQIQVNVNGVSLTNFVYNSVNKQLAFTANLNEGVNNVTVTATNSAGTASDSRVIKYVRQVVVTPPLVTFIQPAAPGTTVNISGYTMRATVSNVSQASQIVVVQDGQIVNPALWSFNAASHEVIMNTNLNVGNNVFTITGTNTGGSHTASTNIRYELPVVVCDKPQIQLTAPATTGLEVQNSAYTVTATIQHINNANQVQLLVNGALQGVGTYNAGTKVYSKGITLNEGQNVIQLVATNTCGESAVTTVIIYKPAAAPCIPPTVTRIEPVQQTMTTQDASVQIRAAVGNVSNASQIKVFVNNASVNFNYDAAAHVVTTDVSLVEGLNTIRIEVKNECGEAVADWTVTRTVCVAPKITVNTSTVPLNTTTYNDNLNLVAAITGVSSSSQINVKLNSQDINFVFNAQTGVLAINQALNLGVNSFLITVQNECGTDILKFGITRRQEQVVVLPPTISIVNPANSPYTISQSGMTVQITTSQVSSANQVSITVNGAATNFNFNAANGGIMFNASFIPGPNVIIATAVNSAGSATDTKKVIYEQPVVVQAPVITLTNPASCPAVVNRGMQTITGTVTNITNSNQVVITYNGAPVNFSSSISNGVLTFSFQISVSNTTVNIPLVITATNAGGSDANTCAISVMGSNGGGNGNGNNGHGNNVDGVDESNPGQGGGGPNGQQGGEGDDENGNNGGGNTNGGNTNGGGNNNGGSTNGGNTNGGGNKSPIKPVVRPGTTVKPKPAQPANP
jgi:hypothetical protein